MKQSHLTRDSDEGHFSGAHTSWAHIKGTQQERASAAHNKGAYNKGTCIRGTYQGHTTEGRAHNRGEGTQQRGEHTTRVIDFTHLLCVLDSIKVGAASR